MRQFQVGEKQRLVKIVLIQGGSAAEDKQENIENNLKIIDNVSIEKSDFICFNELSTTPYFGIVHEPRYFDWAEPIPGPTTDAFAEKAKKYECCILVPIFEKGNLGLYYNSVAVIGPDGEIIPGTLPNGTKVGSYRKVHLPLIEAPTPFGKGLVNEHYYFKGGPGFPVFDTPKVKVGVCICFDRRFPETFRTMALQGCEIAFVPTASPIVTPEAGAATEMMFVTELQTRALENLIWVAGCNKGGYETLAGQKMGYFGRSCIIHPTGQVIAEGPSTEPAILSATIDLEEIARVRSIFPIWKERRPEAYHPGITNT